MGAARLRPTWCLWSTLLTLQAWKKVPSVCEPDHCLFVVVVWVIYKQCPAAQWSDPRRCSCPCAPPGLCVAPRTHVTEGRLENPPSTCNQHQRRRQYLGIPDVLPRTGVLALTTGLSVEAGRWSNFPKVPLTWHHGSTLNLVNRTSY